MSAETGRSLPRYQSHKKVWALKIKEIIPPQIGDPKTKIVPVDSSYALIGVDAEYMAKHKPQPGGYYVVYEGGYKSYSPADAFEAGNTLIHGPVANVTDQDVQDSIDNLDLNAPRITPDWIQSIIVSEQYHVFPGTTFTSCLITLENGFTVLGESACASPENYNAKLGREIAKKSAVGKIWPLEGYLLKERLFNQTQGAEVPQDEVGG